MKLRSIAPPPAPPRTQPLRLHFAGLLAAALLLLSGCEKPARLLSARFVDESKDGAAQTGETIVLTFSEPVDLVDSTNRGIDFSPAPSTGVYTVERGSRNQLVVTFTGGTFEFETAGIHGHSDHPRATGISIDVTQLGDFRTADGRKVSGVRGPVDLEPTAHPPALLRSARWIDTDRSYSVNSGDRVRLEWDRPVQLSADTKRTGVVPDDLIYLPVRDDRLGTKSEPARIEKGEPQGTVEIVLGDGAQLGVEGEYGDSRTRGATGIAINATVIHPQRAILDGFGQGVASDQVIDLEGDCNPFYAAFQFAGVPRGLHHHTATTLPDGRILIVGGQVEGPGNNIDAVMQDAWLYDPTEEKRWSHAGHMKFARCRHSATYFPGEDGEDGTEDDFVLIFGGWDGQKGLSSAEIYLPYADEPELLPITETTGGPSDRSFHTAHALPESQKLIVVGGVAGFLTFNPTVEEIEIRRDGDRYQLVASVVGQLAYPRRAHDSALIESAGSEPRILVIGGYGRQAEIGAERLVQDPSKCNPLLTPELLTLDRTPSVPLLAEDPTTEPSPRLGHRLVPLPEENFPYLLVGGTTLPPDWRIVRPDGEIRDAHRLELDLESTPPRVRYVPCGELAVERFDFATAALANGTVLIVGGKEDGSAASSRVELFDPLGGRWGEFQAFCRSTLTARERFSIARLLDGRWLVVGGNSGEGPNVEVFRGTPF